jgi:predicted dehydrogenase
LPWRLQATESGGGLFFDLGSHTLDILDFILGPLVEVTGVAVNRASPGEVEDSVAMSFRTESDVPGVATWDFAGAVREDVIQITGVKGRVSLSTFGTEPVRWESGEGVQEFDLPHPPHVAQPLIQAIVDELRGHGRCASTGASALRTARVMDRVTESYYGGRDDEFWLRPESWPGRHR